MKAVILLLDLVFMEMGVLSLMVAAAYWPRKGVGLASAAGLAMLLLGSLVLAKGWRSMAANGQKN
ncbi:MAG: hypothetical protein LBP92_15590 [Deltaproteobacteria bacterium]|nr:hypothetical protein [Deltaproteobacteria bacterium]